MRDDLERVVLRFCAQLEREGYGVQRGRAGDAYVIAARAGGGGEVRRYVAGLGDDGVRIEEICCPRGWPLPQLFLPGVAHPLLLSSAGRAARVNGECRSPLSRLTRPR